MTKTYELGTKLKLGNTIWEFKHLEDRHIVYTSNLSGETVTLFEDDLLEMGAVPEPDEEEKLKPTPSDCICEEGIDKRGAWRITNPNCPWHNEPKPDEEEKKCLHEGDKNNFHPQYCRKCGKEFMYDIFSAYNPTPSLEPIKMPKVNINDYGYALVRYSDLEDWMQSVTDTLNHLTKRGGEEK